MAGNKYQTLVNGRDTLIAATQSSSGVGNANQIAALDSTGRLDVTMLPIGVGPDVALIVTSEALSIGDYVNIYNNATVPTCRKADSTNDRPAHGYVVSAFSSAATATVYFEGANANKTGLTPGGRCYLGAAGAVIQTAPVLPTNVISQFLGIAISATAINTDIDDEVVL